MNGSNVELAQAALVMAGDIRMVIQTQTLTVSERMQLMGVLAEMVGSAELAECICRSRKYSEYKDR